MPSSQPNPSSSGGSSSGSSGLSGGPIAGIIVGVAIAVAIASILSVCYWRRRTGGGSSHQTGPTKGAQGTPEEVHRPDQKTEHKGMELHELHDSTQLPEKDSSDEPLMFLAEVGRYE